MAFERRGGGSGEGRFKEERDLQKKSGWISRSEREKRAALRQLTREQRVEFTRYIHRLQEKINLTHETYINNDELKKFEEEGYLSTRLLLFLENHAQNDVVRGVQEDALRLLKESRAIRLDIALVTRVMRAHKERPAVIENLIKKEGAQFGMTEKEIQDLLKRIKMGREENGVSLEKRKTIYLKINAFLEKIVNQLPATRLQRETQSMRGIGTYSLNPDVED